jgi:hypothetical protein
LRPLPLDSARGEPSPRSSRRGNDNLACYECALGNLGRACAHLDRSFQLDKKFRDFARGDPDLAALRE